MTDAETGPKTQPEYSEVNVIKLKPGDLRTDHSAEPAQKEAGYGGLSGDIYDQLLAGKGDVYVIAAGGKPIGHAFLIREKLDPHFVQYHMNLLDWKYKLAQFKFEHYFDHRDTVEPEGMVEFGEIVIRPEEREKKYSRKALTSIIEDFEERYGHHEMFAWVRPNNVSAREFNKIGWCLTRFQGEPLKDDLKVIQKGEKFYRSNEYNFRADTRVTSTTSLPVDCTTSDICQPDDFSPSQKRRFIVPMPPGENNDLEEGGTSHWALRILKRAMRTGKDPRPRKDPIITGVFTSEEMRAAGLPAEDGTFYFYLTRDWNWRDL